MLILTRRVGEKLYIICPDGSRIEVMITKNVGDRRYRVGVTAPKSYTILREEILERETNEED